MSNLETDLILGLAIAGATLGLVEGIKPGPLLTMVIRETLSGGLRAGLWTAAAPIFTDGPLVIFSLFAAAWIATNPSALLVITLAGSIFRSNRLNASVWNPPIWTKVLLQIS